MHLLKINLVYSFSLSTFFALVNMLLRTWLKAVECSTTNYNNKLTAIEMITKHDISPMMIVVHGFVPF